MSAFARQRDVRLGVRRPRRFVFAVALAALLAAFAVPHAHADIDGILGAEKHWDGTVEVSTTTLTIAEGTSATYSVRLSHDPIYYRHVEYDGTELVPCDDASCDWWVFVHIGDQRPTDGVVDLDDDGQNDIKITPSIGRSFDRSDYSQWKTIRINALEDDDSEDQTVTFQHEVWGDDAECPIHLVGRVTVRIIDDEGTTPPPQPALSIPDTTVVEGSTAEFVVTLSPTSSQTVTVDYTTVMGSANPDDYSRQSDTLSFAPHATSRTIRVPTTDDNVFEGSENFTVKLSNPSGATLTDDVGMGTISDNDPLPRLSVGDATVEEGETARFEVTLSPAPARTVTVDYRTAGGSAAEGTDYEAASGTLTFSAGTTRQTIEVRTTEDTDDEPNEAFTVRLTNPNGATLADDSGSGTITDDDDAASDLPTLSIGDASADEGETASFEVTLTGTSTQTVTVAYQTFEGTAVEDTDYEAESGTLTFAVGTTQRTIEVRTIEDTDDEADEAFTVRLTNPNGATLADDSGSGTITDDDESDGDGNGIGGKNNNENNNENGNENGNDVGNRLHRANWTVLPELGRAMAFTAVRCRIEQAFSDKARGWAEPSVRPSPTLVPLPRPPAPASFDGVEEDTRSPTLEQVLGDASFLVPLIGGEGGTARAATWGCGDYRDLSGDGKGRAGPWDAEVFSAQLGLDAIIDTNLLAGVSLSRSKGSLDYSGKSESGESGGRYEMELTGVHPYLGWWVSPDLELWATLGLATGGLKVADDLAATTLSSDATLATGTVGVNGRLLDDGATSLRLKGEMALARLDVSGDGGVLRGAILDLSRQRLAAEAEHERTVPYLGVLVPWGELGLRLDGGDGETGTSLEFGGGLHLRNIEQGWNAEVYGRSLAAQDDALPEERGFGVRVRYDPEAPGFGPWVSLTRSWGETASGIERLLQEDATNPAPHDALARSLDAEVGYGLAAFGGRGLLAPFGSVSLDSDDGRAYRLGGRLTLGHAATLSLEAERRQRRADDDAHGVMLRSSARF